VVVSRLIVDGCTLNLPNFAILAVIDAGVENFSWSLDFNSWTCFAASCVESVVRAVADEQRREVRKVDFNILGATR
jgi:hypothetical protein